MSERELLCCNPFGSRCTCPPDCTCGYCGCRDRLAAEDMLEGLTAAVEANARILAAESTATPENRRASR